MFANLRPTTLVLLLPLTLGGGCGPAATPTTPDAPASGKMGDGKMAPAEPGKMGDGKMGDDKMAPAEPGKMGDGKMAPAEPGKMGDDKMAPKG